MDTKFTFLSLPGIVIFYADMNSLEDNMIIVKNTEIRPQESKDVGLGIDV
jgi:hypothetical protein